MHAKVCRVSLVVAALVAAGRMSGAFEGAARGQAIAAVESSSLSLGQLILRENFDDNEKNAIWRLYAEDPANCALVETNGCLELQAKPAATDAQALYVSSGWRFDPNSDFAMKVDLQYTPVTYAKGWVGFGLTTSNKKPRWQQIGIGMGASGMYPHFWYRTADGLGADTSVAPRLTDKATMYISYHAATDELYVGDGGYGPENAWMVFPDTIKGRWGGQPLYVWLGGSANGLSIASGQATLDNLLVESGTVLQASLCDVYRFWSAKAQRHFYTIDKAEKEKLLTEYAAAWTYEGSVFAAFRDDSDPATRPIYRFWSDRLGGHFYTMDEQEKDKLIEEQRNTWTFEGVAFYAYPSGLQPVWSCPVYRFWSPIRDSHFYTADEAEKDGLITKYPTVWTYEGIAWYALR